MATFVKSLTVSKGLVQSGTAAPVDLSSDVTGTLPSGSVDLSGVALLAGRSGGQTLKGGTASGDKLVLKSTNHGTKGGVEFGEEDWIVLNQIIGGTPSAAAADTIKLYCRSAIYRPRFYLKDADGFEINLTPKFPPGHLHGLTLSNNGTDPTNDIDIAVGSARDVDDTDDMILASALTKRLDAAWAVGTNQGGLDTGSIANTTYFVWLIKRDDTRVVDVLFSTSATNPTMPSNYQRKRRIGAIVRTGGAILLFVQDGDHFGLKTPVLDIAATAPGTSAVLRTLASLPSGIRVRADMRVGYTDTSGTGAGNPAGMNFQDPSATDFAPSAALCDVLLYPGGANLANLLVPHAVYTNTSAQIRTRCQLSHANLTLYGITYGWWDDRGRN